MSTPRRSFLGRLGAFLALGATPPSALAADVTRGGTPFAPDERWLSAMVSREHKLFIEMGSATDATAFRRGMNFLDAYKTDYGIPETGVGLTIGLHGSSIALAMNEEIWAKHRLGELAGLKDASGAFVTVHPWRAGSPFSIAALAARGVFFLACNNSLRRLSRQLAEGPAADEMHRTLVANVAPPMQVVPAMAVSASRAQERGIPYLAIA